MLTLLFCTPAAAYSTTAAPVFNAYRYGTSVLGRDLACYELYNPGFTKTAMLTFAMHGFEDGHFADGQGLKDMANAIIEYYKTSGTLGDTRLLIVPCVNPDGLAQGTTTEGFGRCTATGVDINRDFDANHIPITKRPRNYTPYAFSAAESRALRDLYNIYRPDIVLDFHGWLNYTVGDVDLARAFYSEAALPHRTEFTENNANGFYSYWAQTQGSKALLVELLGANDLSVKSVIRALDSITSGRYLNANLGVTLDARFARFGAVEAYPLTSASTTLYKGFNMPFEQPVLLGEQASMCTLDYVYANGWVQVSYTDEAGRNTAYCRLSSFVPSGSSVEPYTVKATQQLQIYSHRDLSRAVYSVDAGGELTVTAQADNIVQAVHLTPQGQYIIGWVNSSLISAAQN